MNDWQAKLLLVLALLVFLICCIKDVSGGSQK